jgi:hypothetical protein
LLISATACATPSQTSDETQSPSSETTQAFFPAVERTSYGKATFQMIGFTQPGDWYYAQEMNQSTLNDAIYEMNKSIEDYLDVTIAYEQVTSVTTGGEIFDKVRPSLASGDDTYQLCILHPYYSYNSFISYNYAYDFYNFDSLDLTQDYWNKTVIDSLAINGHAYIALGDLCWYDVYVLYCNKYLMKQMDISTPYDAVRSGDWTLDAFISLSTNTYIDSNGDGSRNNGDTYGFASMWDANGSAFMQASDIYVVKRDENDQFELSLYGTKLEDFYEKLYNWSKNESVYLWEYADRNNANKALDFLDGRSCFTLHALGTDYLSADFDVGILPLPKYDTYQEQYAHVNWGNNIVVPNSIQNAQMVGDVLELMAYYSSTVVHNAYYDTVLQFRVSNSPDDREMVELVYNTIVFDPGIAYCDGNDGLWNLVYLPCFGIRLNQAQVSSYYKKYARSAQRGLDKLFDQKSS